MNLLYVSSLLILSAATDGVNTQLSISEYCQWNYTEKRTNGSNLYSVFTRQLNSSSFKYHRSTINRVPGFQIEMLGEESDEKRRLFISWETDIQSNTLMISYNDLRDKMFVLRRKYFHFRIENISSHIKPYRIRFDCLEVTRGVRLYVNVCDVPPAGRRKRHQPPACTGKTIDSISCNCEEASLNVTGVANVHQDKPATTIKIEYSNLPSGLKMYVDVKKAGQIETEYVLDSLTLRSHNGHLTLPDAIKSPGNFTIEIVLFCQDYSDNRSDHECQRKSFPYENKPVFVDTPPKIQKDPGHTLVLTVIFGVVGVIILIASFCFIYNWRKHLKEIICSIWRRREPYDPVSSGGPSKTLLNNAEQNTIHQRTWIILSHYASVTDSVNLIERTLLGRLKSAGFKSIYSWDDRQLAFHNWQKMSEDFLNDCTDVIIILSEALLDLLELSSKQDKNEKEKGYFENLLSERFNENVPHLTLQKLLSTNHKTDIHVLSTSQTRKGSDVQKFGMLYPQLFSCCNVYSLAKISDTLRTDEGNKLRLQSILASSYLYD